MMYVLIDLLDRLPGVIVTVVQAFPLDQEFHSIFHSAYTTEVACPLILRNRVLSIFEECGIDFFSIHVSPI